MRTCVFCLQPVVACTMGPAKCAFSGWVHERSRLHQCHPIGIAGRVYRPYAYGRRWPSEVEADLSVKKAGRNGLIPRPRPA